MFLRGIEVEHWLNIVQHWLKKTPIQVLSCEICKLFNKNILKNICECLLLNFI